MMGGGGVIALFLTPVSPLHRHTQAPPHPPTLFYLALHNTSTQVHCPLPDLELWLNGLFPPTTPLSSPQGIVWSFQGTSFRAMSGCWVTKRLLLFNLRVGDEQCDSPRLQFAQHAILGWELLLEHPPTNCSVGAHARNIASLKSQFGTSDCAFNTLNCLLTALPTGPTYSLHVKK